MALSLQVKYSPRGIELVDKIIKKKVSIIFKVKEFFDLSKVYFSESISIVRNPFFLHPVYTQESREYISSARYFSFPLLNRYATV